MLILLWSHKFTPTIALTTPRRRSDSPELCHRRLQVCGDPSAYRLEYVVPRGQVIILSCYMPPEGPRPSNGEILLHDLPSFHARPAVLHEPLSALSS